MITLITGNVGSGKTWTTLASLEQVKSVPLYLEGFTGTYDVSSLAVTPIPDNCGFLNWQSWLPENAVLVVDEFQTMFRVNRFMSAVDSLLACRETGNEFIFITQTARSLPKALLNQVDWHRHVVRLFHTNGSPVTLVHNWDFAANPDCEADLKASLPMRIYAKGSK